MNAHLFDCRCLILLILLFFFITVK